MCTEARQHVGSAKQCSKLSLGRNKHGQNITTPILCTEPALHENVDEIHYYMYIQFLWSAGLWKAGSTTQVDELGLRIV